MQSDETSRDRVVEEGTEVCRASYDGGALGFSGTASVYKFEGAFWAVDDNGGFDGPHDSLSEALGEQHLCFGDVEVTVRVTGMTAAEYADMMTVEAPAGRVVEINGKEWVLDEDGVLARVRRRSSSRRETGGCGRARPTRPRRRRA